MIHVRRVHFQQMRRVDDRLGFGRHAVGAVVADLTAVVDDPAGFAADLLEVAWVYVPYGLYTSCK